MSYQDQILNKCGCCEGIKSLTPVSTKNLPGLDALVYRAGTHGSFLETMLSKLPEEPELAELTTRDADDPAIGLLDAWSTVLDVLTFYQERIINEGFLRTALERRSVLELARHISYKLRPGVAAGTYLAFRMEEAQGSPLNAIIPVGTKAQSVPGQNQLPQVFETVEEILAKKSLNTLSPQTSQLKIPSNVDREIYLKGILTGLKTGDTLVIIWKENTELWDFVRIEKVETDDKLDRTKVTLERYLHGRSFNSKKELPEGKNFQVFTFRQRAFLFGYNAPDWHIISDVVKQNFPLLVSGLLGEYYNGCEFNSYLLTNIDQHISFNWQYNSPYSSINVDQFSIRWTGVIKIHDSGNYTFYTDSDDGVRLWIDEKLIIDHWSDQHETEHSGHIWLESGEFYNLKLEYYEKGGYAIIQLRWEGPGITKRLVPAKVLYHKRACHEWPNFDIASISETPQSEKIETIYLDNLYSGIAEGSWLIMASPETEPYGEVFKVTSVDESSREGFTLSTKSTAVELDGKNENIRQLFNNKIRETIIYVKSEELEMAEAPVTIPVEGDEIVLDKLIPDLPEKRAIIISGKRMRVKLADNVNPPELISPYTSKGLPMSSSDSYLLLKTPENDPVKGLFWVLKNKNGFIGSLNISIDKLQLIPSYDNDEIVSEINWIEQITDADPTTIILKNKLVNSFDRKTVSIYANVARATHGETKNEILGSRNGAEVFQRFELKQKPLTYISAQSAGGISSTLSVRVNDILWKEVPTLYGCSPDERVYTVRIADDGKVSVQFGDGSTGARLPSGVENVKASFRIGTGFDGQVEAGQISQLMSRPLGVKDVINPLAPSGADNPETLEKARRNAPLKVLAMDRIVSLKDFEDFTRAYPGIGKAHADLLWQGEERIVFITIAAADGTTISDKSGLFRNLVLSIDSARHSNYKVRVGSFTLKKFTVEADVLIDTNFIEDDVKIKVSDTLKYAYSFEKRDFGQAVTPSEIISVIQAVPGVIAVDLKALNGINPSSYEHYFLMPGIAKRNNGNIDPAELLTINEDGITLGKMSLQEA